MERSVYQLTVAALFAALLCIVGPLTIPVGPVPVSLANLVILLAAWLLGARMGTVSVLVYFLLGAFGLPVFSGAGSGFAQLLGPTGGYLVGYVFLAVIAGAMIDRTDGAPGWGVVGMVLGEIALYFFGTGWYVIQSGVPLGAAMAACVLPFLPFDAGKIGLAGLLGPLLRRRITAAGLLPVRRRTEKAPEK